MPQAMQEALQKARDAEQDYDSVVHDILRHPAVGCTPEAHTQAISLIAANGVVVHRQTNVTEKVVSFLNNGGLQSNIERSLEVTLPAALVQALPKVLPPPTPPHWNVFNMFSIPKALTAAITTALSRVIIIGGIWMTYHLIANIRQHGMIELTPAEYATMTNDLARAMRMR